jgi:ABC-type Fe3+ transport system substrate-binding protein
MTEGRCWPVPIAAMIACTLFAPASAKDWSEVEAGAKKEGTLTVYHSQLGAPHWKAVVDAFQRKYRIEVKEFEGRVSEVTERIRVEQSSGRAIADVEFNGLATIVDQRKSDFVAEIGEIPNAKNIRADVPPADKWQVPAWNQLVCALINTRLVAPVQEPKTYADFLKPEFRGKILSDDMAAIGAGQTFFAVAYQKYGPAFLQRFKEQNLSFDRDLQQMSRRVARGEYPMLLTQIVAFAYPLRSLPVKVLVPEEGCPLTAIQGAVLRNAPHPDAARLFINHFLDTESQLIYANAWMGTVVNGIADRLTDADAKRFAQIKMLGYITPDVRDAMLKAATEMFK